MAGHRFVLVLFWDFLQVSQSQQTCNWLWDFDPGTPGNAHVVDSYKGNLLMRLAWPAVNTKQCIVESLTHAAGDLWPIGKYELFDASLSGDAGELELFGDKLLNFVSNYPAMPEAFAAECKKQSGGNASSCPYQMQPKDVPAETRLRMALDFKQWDVDSLEAHVQAVRRVLVRTDGPPRIIFFHCESGKDRTGEFFAAYKMRYMNTSLTDAWRTNVQIARRPMIYPLQVNVQWYCNYLHSQGLYRGTDCDDCTKFTKEMLVSLLSCQNELFEHNPSLSPRCQSILDRFHKPLCTPMPVRSDNLFIANLGSTSGEDLTMRQARVEVERSMVQVSWLAIFSGIVCGMFAIVVWLRRRGVPTQEPLLG